MEPIDTDINYYQRAEALGLAVQLYAGKGYNKWDVLNVAETFLNWLNNNVEGA